MIGSHCDLYRSFRRKPTNRSARFLRFRSPVRALHRPTYHRGVHRCHSPQEGPAEEASVTASVRLSLSLSAHNCSFDRRQSDEDRGVVSPLGPKSERNRSTERPPVTGSERYGPCAPAPPRDSQHNATHRQASWGLHTGEKRESPRSPALRQESPRILAKPSGSLTSRDPTSSVL